MTIHQVQPTWESVLLDWAYQPLEAHVPIERMGAAGHTLNAAYRACTAITRAHSRTFTIASGLLPPDQRWAARALYAFCRMTDNIIDLAGGEDVDITRGRLNAWRALSLHGHPTINQTDEMRLAALAWSDARARYNIPTGYAEQLIDGVARDLDKKRYATFDELAEYAYAVASTVGLMAMHIIGFDGEEAIPYAVKLGVALQVTNILRDVREDWLAGRLYLPQDELAHFGLCEANIDAAISDDRWRAFMDYQIARTRRLYDEAYQGIALLNPRGRFAVAAAADLYRAILGDIERHDNDVFSRRAHVSALRKASLLPTIWWRSRTVKITN